MNELMNIIDGELNEKKVKFYYYYFGDLRLPNEETK